jgi:hypothetical protein
MENLNYCKEIKSNKLCKFEKCNKNAAYNYKDINEKLYCNDHKMENMINLVSKKCEFNDCYLKPSFNFDNQKAKFCSTHKVEGMINIAHKTSNCTYLNCSIRASYNFENIIKPIYCAKHKSENMIIVTIKLCEFKDCNVLPSFNIIGKKNGIYCLTHKLENMVDVKHDKAKCKEDNCNTRSTYNYKNIKSPAYCVDHKLPDMIDVCNKQCEFNGCTFQPNFNFIEEKIGRFCSIHKLENMVNVTAIKCKFDNCTKHPTYNNINDKIGLYCVEHKLENMIDVKHKRCNYENCLIRASYNYENEKIGIYCVQHKKDDMIDKTHIKCLTPLCIVRATPKYDNYCFRCYIYTFPDKPTARNYKTKEQSTTDYIKIKYPNYTWIIDKKIRDGCSLRRPDLLLDLGYQVIIIEVDENQHNNYSCENKRLMEISQDINHRSLIFIRFNPDAYTQNNKKKLSCWILDGNGLCVIRNKDKWNERLLKLYNEINYWIDNKTDKTIELVELFYDK